MENSFHIESFQTATTARNKNYMGKGWLRYLEGILIRSKQFKNLAWKQK